METQSKKDHVKNIEGRSCGMCGKFVSDKHRVDLNVDGSEYVFDSQSCLLTFQKLLAVYGKEFFLSKS